MNSIIATLVRKPLVLRGLERVCEAKPEEGGASLILSGEESGLFSSWRVLEDGFSRCVTLIVTVFAYLSFLCTI